MNEQEKGQSFFISPLSAQFNLGMLANGAAGKTLEEIASVLSVSKSKPSLANNYFLKLISNLPRLDSTTVFQSANSIWIHDKSPVKDSFQQMNRQYFLAEIQNLDFLNRNQQALSTDGQRNKRKGVFLTSWIRHKVTVFSSIRCSSKVDGFSLLNRLKPGRKTFILWVERSIRST